MAEKGGGSGDRWRFGGARGVNTFMTIDLFACWFGISFGQKSPDDVGEAVLCAMKEGLEVCLPSDGGLSCCMVEGGGCDGGCGGCCGRGVRCSCHEEREGRVGHVFV